MGGDRLQPPPSVQGSRSFPPAPPKRQEARDPRVAARERAYLALACACACDRALSYLPDLKGLSAILSGLTVFVLAHSRLLGRVHPLVEFPVPHHLFSSPVTVPRRKPHTLRRALPPNIFSAGAPNPTTNLHHAPLHYHSHSAIARAQLGTIVHREHLVISGLDPPWRAHSYMGPDPLARPDFHRCAANVWPGLSAAVSISPEHHGPRRRGRPRPHCWH